MADAPKYKDAETEKIHLDYFSGGNTVDYKLGIPNSFYFSQNLDFRTYPSQLSVLPGLSTVTNNVNDLVTAIDQDLSGVRWAVGSSGNLYKVSTNDVFSVEATLPELSSAGILYNQITDQLYIPGQTAVSMFGQVTTGVQGSPAFRPNNFGPSASTDDGCVRFYNPNDGFYDGNFRNNAESQAIGITPSNYTSLITNTLTNTYTVPTSIIETSGQYCFFAPDIEPFYSVAVYLPTVISGGASNATATAGTGGDNGSSWSNTSNVTGASGFATATAGGSHSSTSTLEATNFGFSIPSNATITGVSVTVTKMGSSGTDLDASAQLIVAGSPTGSNLANGINWSNGIPANSTYGGSSNLWGLSLTPAQVNASNFGFGISGSGGFGDTLSVQNVQITVYYAASGSLTLTMHDSLNTLLGQATVANPVAGWNNFVFNAPVRAIVQQSQTGGSATYHWHITCQTANSSTVATNVTSDVSTANFLLFANRLVQPHNGWHPTTIFQNLLCIGNERYLSTYDFTNDSGPTNTQWVRHELIFKAGYEVCGLSTNNQYLVIALERRSNNPNRNAQDGQLVFWDGTTQNPNIIIDIPMGSPYGLTTFNSVTYFICAGSLFAWSGGQTVLKVRKLSYQNTNYLGTVDSTIVNPNMMAIRYNLLEIGYPSSTTNSNLNYGVYEWGAVELQYPNSLGLSYTLANGFLNNASPISGLQIGCVYNFVDHMYVSWQYTDANSQVHYGVDVLSNSSTPATSFNFQTLIYDSGLSYKQKVALRMQITFLPLPSGYNLQAQYSVNRGAFTLSSAATTGSTKLVFEVDPQPMRFHELQWGFTGTSSGATTPLVVTGVTMEVNPLPEETDMTANAE